MFDSYPLYCVFQIFYDESDFSNQGEVFFNFFFWLHDLWVPSSSTRGTWQWMHGIITADRRGIPGRTLHRRKNEPELNQKIWHMCLPVSPESIVMESQSSLYYLLFIFLFFFQTILISASWEIYCAWVLRKDSGKATCILCCLLPQGTHFLGQDCEGSLRGCLLLRGIEVSARWLKLTPTSFHLLGTS